MALYPRAGRRMPTHRRSEDVEGFPFGLITPGFCSMLSEAYDRMHARAANGASGQGSEDETEEDA